MSRLWRAAATGLCMAPTLIPARGVQYISAIVMVWLLVHQKRLYVRHLRTPPSLAECWPVIQARPCAFPPV